MKALHWIWGKINGMIDFILEGFEGD